MVLSIAVYTTTAAILAYLGWHVNHREQRMIAAGQGLLSYCSWEIILSILVFAIVAGARYGTGYDHIYYLSQYIQLRDMGGFSRTSYEPGFVLISKAFAALNAHAFFYFAFWGALQIGLFYFALRNRKFLLIWVSLIIMFGGFFINWMNSIRQVVVECALIAMLPLLYSQKWFLKVCGLSLLLALIHASALLIPLFMLIVKYFRVKWTRRKLCMSVFVGCILLGIYPFWIKVLDIMTPLLPLVGYTKYIPMLGEITHGTFRLVPWGPIHVVTVATQLLLIWYYPDVKKHFGDDRLLSSTYILSFVGVCLSNMFVNTSHFVLRPIEYMLLCTIVVAAYTFQYLFKSKRWCAFAILSVCVFSVIFIAVFKAVYDPIPVNTPYLYNIIFFYL